MTRYTQVFTGGVYDGSKVRSTQSTAALPTSRLCVTETVATLATTAEYDPIAIFSATLRAAAHQVGVSAQFAVADFDGRRALLCTPLKARQT